MVTIAETTEPGRGAKDRRITTHGGYIEALRERAEVSEELAVGGPTWRDENLRLT